MSVTDRCKWKYAGPATQSPEVDCERPKQLVDLLTGESRVIPCRSSSRSVCSPCGKRYQRRVRRIAASGVVDSPGSVVFMVTLTAPGVRVHRLPSGKVCECTPPGGVVLPVWNARAGRRFAEFLQHLRRSTSAAIEYFRAAEPQDRRALHYHVLIRTPIPLHRRLRALRKLAIHHGFGHEIDVQVINGLEAASYCAKGAADYVSKAVDVRHLVPWMDLATGELVRARYRTWSASKNWGSTMAALRALQKAWVQRQASDPAERSEGADALDSNTPCITSEGVSLSDPPSEGGF